MMRVVDQMLDLIWAGFLGTPHIAGIGVAQQYTQMAWTARQGVDTAQRAMVSRAIGMGNIPLARLSVFQAGTVTAVFWVVIAALGIILTEPMLLLLGVPDNVIDKAVPYMRVQFAGQGFMAFQQLSNQALVASGDPITPMRSQIVSRILHGVLSPILVFGPGPLPAFGIAGAPMAASTGNAIAMGLNCRVLFSARSMLHLKLSDYRIEPKLIWQILRIGGPAAVNGAERSVAQLVMVAFVTPFGANALAAFTLSRRVEMFANLGSQGFGQASGVIVGQNLGAGKPNRGRATILWALGFVISIKGALSILLFLFPSIVLQLFTRDPELLALASSWVRIQCLGNIAMGANNVFQQSFMTAGATMWPMLVTVLGLWGLELPLAYALSQPLGFGALGIAYATLIASCSRPLLHLPYFLSNRWMRAKVFSDQTPAIGRAGQPDSVPVGPYSA
jgi:putative MATE family efflux protein